MHVNHRRKNPRANPRNGSRRLLTGGLYGRRPETDSEWEEYDTRPSVEDNDSIDELKYDNS